MRAADYATMQHRFDLHLYQTRALWFRVEDRSQHRLSRDSDFYQNLDVTSGSRNAHLLLQVYQNVCVDCLKICKTYSASKQRYGMAYSRLLYCDKGFVARGPVSDVNLGAGQVRR